MKIKMTLVGLGAMVAVVFAAFPTTAAAGEPELSCGGAVCGKFTAHSSTALYSASG